MRPKKTVRKNIRNAQSEKSDINPDKPVFSRAVISCAEEAVRMTFEGVPLSQALKKRLNPTEKWDPTRSGQVVESCRAYFRWFGWLKRTQPVHRQIRMALSIQERFSTQPKWISHQALIQNAVPSWLGNEMEITLDWIQYLQKTPVLWIRSSKKWRQACTQALRDCIEPSQSGLSGCYAWTSDQSVYQSQPYQQGWLEIQDLGSQFVGWVCQPKPGQKWWDMCAGEGGKTLHLAEFMEGKGILYASDRSARKLAGLRARCKRAGVQNYQSKVWDAAAEPPWKFPFDGILIDAPCSGVGVWHRHPDARWSTKATDVCELSLIQKTLLGRAARAIRKGGRLVYAVCTLTHAETESVMEEFLSGNPGFSTDQIEPIVPEIFVKRGKYGLYLNAPRLKSNGMYVASLTFNG